MDDTYDTSQDPECPYCHDNDMTVEIDGTVLWACLKCDSTFTAHGQGYKPAGEGEVIASVDDAGSDAQVLPEPKPNQLTRLRKRDDRV